MAAETDGQSPGKASTRWNSFSNYGDIAEDVHQAVVGAIEAQAFIHAMHQEGARVSPEDAAEASARMLSAARRLLTEMRRENERNSDGPYDDILEKWEGPNGYISQLAGSNLSDSSPAFLHDFVEDIHRAAFEIGYIRAGREERQDLDDPVENDAMAMFEEPEK